MAGRMFGERPVGAVTLVETPVSRSYAQKARVAFLVVAASVALVVAATASVALSLPLAVVVGLVSGGVCGLVVACVVRVWPALRVLWWWAVEIVAAVTVFVGMAYLSRATHPAVPLVLLAVVLGVLFGVGRLRRRVSAWVWCVVVRHRLRLCFTEFIRSASRLHPGRLPLILWARPTPAGERVWVWLRPGLDLTDLDGKADKLAVACWAGEARMVRASARHAALVRVDITRRDPLTGLVASPLSAWVAWMRDEDAPVSPAVPPVGLDLLDVPEPAPPQQRSPRR
ncbi:hypothetical protein [Micromonospora sp. B006]|uniref:hypothetical protein n=1 Tax=Micromonospora sp. B006 TaxID=2201999 RepID=UPI000E30525C|nr:hypothetical protein [Micromonospora sp. B006]